MSITALNAFDHAIKRANHFLKLYEILHDNRQRSARNHWRRKFNKCMRWPEDENIVRVDGKDKESMLILRASTGITREHFAHEYVSELLRAAIVSGISAMDRFMHDIIVERSITLLNKKEADIPSELKNLKISVLATKKALEKLRKERKSRPGHIIKKEIQMILHKDWTFQNQTNIEKGAKMLGINDFWGKIVSELPGTQSKGKVQEKLRTICQRRNQIVHEADLILKTRAKEITTREITYKEAEDYIVWIYNFVRAINRLAYA